MKYRSLLTLLALVIAITAPAALVAQEDEQPDKTIEVTATEYEFSPDEFEAKTGQTIEVKLVNEGNIAHSYDIKKFDIASKKVSPGESTTVTFTPEEPGKIQFVCDVPGHKKVGMKGTLVVEE